MDLYHVQYCVGRAIDDFRVPYKVKLAMDVCQVPYILNWLCMCFLYHIFVRLAMDVCH
jgi:hypothetical protein